MNTNFLKSLLAASIIAFLSLDVNAADANAPAADTKPAEAQPAPVAQPATEVKPAEDAKPTETKSGESFQSICLDSWLKRVTNDQNKVDYKNFGEKYCECAASQPLDNDQAIDKAIQLCMSRTLLKDAMDALDDSVGITEATDKQVGEYCESRWKLVYPTMNDNVKAAATAYCDCAKPKLLDLNKRSEDMTDNEYYDGINEIAATCSTQLQSSEKSSSN